MKKRAALLTFGCRANQYQTDVLKNTLFGEETEIVPFNEFAHEYLINTCTVTHDADRKSRQAIRRAIRQNPKAKIFAAGCYAKLKGKELKAVFPQIEIILPDFLSPNPINHCRRVRANLMIENGCENFCSYCIVPYARGRVSIKPAETVLAQARQMVKNGVKEIVLTGINLGAYGKGLSPLLSELSMIEGLMRIRLSSIEPMYATKELVETIAGNKKACHHLHIPLQSGDDQILKAMNRTYSIESYLNIVRMIRETIPDCGISTDIMVGFPGEGSKEFQNTLIQIERIGFSRLHVFSYSKREGTKAVLLPDQIPAEIKKERNTGLNKLNLSLTQKFARRYLGKKIEILVEQRGEGLTSNFIRCFFEDQKDSTSKMIKLAVQSINNRGEIRGKKAG